MRIVVLGTGTNVGKTYVTRRLAVALRRSARVLALKPIESGVAEDGAAGDAESIAEAAEHSPRLSSWRFPLGVSPHLAARKHGRSIAIADVAAWIRAEETRHDLAPHHVTRHVVSLHDTPPHATQLHDVAQRDNALHDVTRGVTIIETAGGVFSPLSEASTNYELALALEPALWVLVAPDALGVLHDLTATLRALRRAPDAVVLSSARTPDASTGSNAEELARLGIAKPLVSFGYEPSRAPFDAEPLRQWALEALARLT